MEESKTSGGSIASALAGQFGFDLGSLSGGNGVLAGDNVLELLKSRTLLKKALLTPAQNPQSSLADLYADVYGLRGKWKKRPGNWERNIFYSRKRNRKPTAG